MSVTAIPNGLSRPRERWSRRKAIYYRETATLVQDSGAAREDDAMASMTNLLILYRMYIRRSKIHYNIGSKGISYEPCSD